MGKYSNLKTVLPRQIGKAADDDDPNPGAWEEDVKKLVARYSADVELVAIDKLGDAYDAARDSKDEADAGASEAAKHVEALQRVLVVRLEEKNLTGFSTAEHVFDLDDQPQATCIDPDAFIKFVKENGMEHLLSVHANTRKAIAVERYANGVTETPGLELKLRTTIKRRKKK